MAYTPGMVPESEKDLPRFLREELAQLAATLEVGLLRNVEFLTVAPAKPREGMVRGADGTYWNPGSGQGVYCYYAAAWHLLG